MKTMKELVGAEFPLFAFSHCRDVVAAVSRSGGFGVLGGSSFTPEELERELSWIDDHVDGKPYGIDILVPEHQIVGANLEDLVEKIPQEVIDFTVGLLNDAGINATAEDVVTDHLVATDPTVGEELMDVAFRHPIRLIANALGIAPESMISRAREHGVPVAALVGADKHAVRQVKAGVDVVVAQGGEAGGHCGEVSTLTLVPEVIRAIEKIRPVPVLAAGGIMTGEQMAGCMAMGAAGVWTGSVWLATTDAETSPSFRDKMIAASSRDTIRSTARTGKPSRQLKSAWHEAWHGEGAPDIPGLPLMPMVSTPAFKLIEKAAEGGNQKARDMLSYWVGQGVGLVEYEQSATGVVEDFKTGFVNAATDLMASIGG